MLKINKCMKNVNFKISDSTKKFLFAVALTVNNNMKVYQKII